MTPIRTNKPVFFGDDGEVLKSGKIYIGQPNQWPIDFPKTVTFQDSAGSQFTASQPLATDTQGRITYNGKPVIALVDGNYSILVRDRNGVTVGEGYTPFVENAATAEEGDSTTQVGLLLSDIKAFDVTPGETVRNVGKATTLDGLGADWLVVSNTGGAADDIDLIDFANGTQGKRINNVAYRSVISEDIGLGKFKPESPTLVWSGSSDSVPMASLSEQGPGFYVLVKSGGNDYGVYIRSEGQPAFGSCQGIPIVGTDLEVVTAFYNGSVFRIERSRTDSGAYAYNLITEIYKV